MAFIRTIPEDAATGSLQRQYAARRKASGRVYRIVQLHSLDPGALRASMALYAHVTTRPDAPLGRLEREAIAVVVSRANDCFY